MREDKFRRWIKKEIETEAAALEKHAGENEELSSLQMPEDSFADLMQRIGAREKDGTDAGKGRAGAKVFHFRRRMLIAVALIAVLLVGTGIGVAGERLFEPEVTGEIQDGEYNVRVESGDETIYLNLDETEAYEEIEERLGILALRLGYKPKEMAMTKVIISENMGEARMEFSYNAAYFVIYQNKQNSNAVFDLHIDGNIINKIELFHNEKKVNILKIDKNETGFFYAVQFEYANAYYYVMSDFDLNDFTQIVQEIFFENM